MIRLISIMSVGAALVGMTASAWGMPPAGAVTRPIGAPPFRQIGPPLRPATRLRVAFVLAPRHPAQLQAAARAVSTPGSPQYHHFWTPTAVWARFGPAAAVRARDMAALRAAGYQALRAQGWIIYATAPVSVLRRTLAVRLYHPRTPGLAVVPNGPYHIRIPLADIATITGLTRVTPPALRWRAPIWHPARRWGAARPTQASGLTGRWLTTTVPTGLPATAVIANVPAGSTVAYVSQLTGPGTAWWGAVEGPDAGGTLTLPVAATRAGTYTMQLTVATPTGQDPVTLPPLTVQGPPAAQGPVRPATVNAALGASALVAASTERPRTIGLYAEAAPDLTDLTAFEQANGLAPLTVHTVSVGGYTPPPFDPTQLPDLEAAEDLQALAMTAPGATVLLTTVDPTLPWPAGVEDALNSVATAGGPTVYSISYGSPESDPSTGTTPGLWTALANTVAAANLEGTTVVASAGDNGAYATLPGDAPPTLPSVDVPAAVPAVTAVGGVDWRATSDPQSFATAAWGGTVWQPLQPSYLQQQLVQPAPAGNLLSGGGYSQAWPEPPWQAALAPGLTGRGVPDVALPASAYFPGIAFQWQGAPAEFGGTSLAAPLFAGYLADILTVLGTAGGNINPLLYGVTQHDPALMIQAQYGYDGLWSVTPGAAWNPLTGLGTPNIGRLAVDMLEADTPVDVQWNGPLWVTAGLHVMVPVRIVTNTGQAVTWPLPATITVAGPRGTVTAAVTVADGTVPVGPVTDTGHYTITVRLGAQSWVIPVGVAPGWPASWRISTPPTYTPGKPWPVRLVVRDIYGNLDWRAVGAIRWTWRWGRHVAHAITPLRGGIARATWHPPLTATGTVTTAAVVVWWHQRPLP